MQQAPNSLTRGPPSLRPNQCRARAARRQRSLDPFQWLPPRRSGPLRLPTARDSELQNAIDHARHPLHPFRGLRYSHWHRRRRRSRPPCHLSRRRRRHLVPNPSPIVDLVRHDRTRQRFGLRGGPRRRRSRRSDRCGRRPRLRWAHHWHRSAAGSAAGSSKQFLGCTDPKRQSKRIPSVNVNMSMKVRVYYSCSS